jgi:mono/diheme cytochrome c family protein
LLAAGVLPVAVGAQDRVLEKWGRDLVVAKCSQCHAVERTGASVHAEAPPFRTLSKKYPIDSLAEALAEGLSVGHPDMPEVTFQPYDVSAILAYLKSIQER